MPVLATVRNTGSNFLLSILEPHYKRHYLTEDIDGEPLWFSHTENDCLGLLTQRIESHPPLIMTMRHPMDVAQSWVKREKALDREFRSMWLNLIALSHREHYFVPVDTEDREERLQSLSERLEKPLKTDWKPVCATGNSNTAIKGMSYSACREFFLKTGFFEQFGYDLWQP